MPVRYKNGNLTFKSLPEAHTQRAHYSEKFGDTAASIHHTAGLAWGPDQVKAQDFNTTLLMLKINATLRKLMNWSFPDGTRVHVSIGAHWPTVGANGYTHWIDAHGKWHSLTKGEKRMTMQHWVDTHGGTIEALRMLRKPNNDHPLLWIEAIAIAGGVGVLLTPETKSRSHGTSLGADTIVVPCRMMNYPCWPMFLPKQSRRASGNISRMKCYWLKKRGGHPNMIFGKGVNGARRRLIFGKRFTRSWKVKPEHFW